MLTEGFDLVAAQGSCEGMVINDFRRPPPRLPAFLYQWAASDIPVGAKGGCTALFLIRSNQLPAQVVPFSARGFGTIPVPAEDVGRDTALFGTLPEPQQVPVLSPLAIAALSLLIAALGAKRARLWL